MQLRASEILFRSFFEGEFYPLKKPPHRPTGTPPRAHRYTRQQRFGTFNEEGQLVKVRKPRLFKGHRA